MDFNINFVDNFYFIPLQRTADRTFISKYFYSLNTY